MPNIRAKTATPEFTAATRPEGFAIRNATAADLELLYRIKRGTLKHYVEQIWGWDEQQQHVWFREDFEPSDFKVIEINGEAAGFTEIKETVNEVKLLNIALLPGYQNQGIGTHLLTALQARARGADKALSLQVFKLNPARVWYERLGFDTVGETEHHIQLRWQADS